MHHHCPLVALSVAHAAYPVYVPACRQRLHHQGTKNTEDTKERREVGCRLRLLSCPPWCSWCSWCLGGEISIPQFVGEVVFEVGLEDGEEAHGVAVVAEAGVVGDADIGDGADAHRAVAHEGHLA